MVKAKRIWLAIFFVSIFIALVLTGCGKRSSDDDSDEMVLHHIVWSKVQTMDSGNMRGVYSMQVAGQIFEPLYTMHFLKRPYEVIPLLADGMPEISEDKLTYTMKIKKGVYFQDDPCFEGGKGRELKAGDFIYALKRIANIKYLSQNWSGFKDKIVGLDEFREYTKGFESSSDVDLSPEIEGLRAVDDYTIVVKLKKPWPQIIDTIFTDLLSSPVAREAVDYYGPGIVNHPVGTGPYKLKIWQKGSYFELVRNENWRGELYPSEGEDGDLEAGYLDDAGKPIPFADRIIFRVIEETQPAWLLFLDGQIDSMGIPKDNFNDAVDTAKGGAELTENMKARNIHLEKFIDPSTFWVGFNMKDPLLGNNKPLRIALSRAIDREKFIDIFTNNRAMVAHGVVAPTLDSYDPEIEKYGYSKYDPQESKELLVEAEKINGGPLPALKLAMPGTDTFSRQYGEFLQEQLSTVGLELEVDYMDWPTYMGKVNTGSVQMFASGVSAGLTDALDFLGMFATKYFAPGGNKFYYSNPEFDALYEKAEVMFPSPERIELYRKMERMVMEDYPAAFINHRISYVLYHDWYKNYKPHVFSYGLSKYRRVDVEKRKAYKELLKTLR